MLTSSHFVTPQFLRRHAGLMTYQQEPVSSYVSRGYIFPVHSADLSLSIPYGAFTRHTHGEFTRF